MDSEVLHADVSVYSSTPSAMEKVSENIHSVTVYKSIARFK